MAPQVLLGFDMETDIGSWTPSYEGLVHGTPKLMEVLSKHSIRATFLFTADSARAHPKIVNMVAEAGHEVGCHSLCHETIGDELFPIPGVRPLLPEEIFRRIQLNTEIVEDIVCAKVTSFRAPRLWGSTTMVNALETLGYSADLTYPMYFYSDRLVPYHPSREDWTVEGDLRILEIPNFADMTVGSNDPYGRDRDQWPLFRTEGADAVMTHIENMQGFYAERHLGPTFCFYLHPWEFHEMPQGPVHYGEGSVIPDQFIVRNCGSVALAELDKLVAILKGRRFQFRTARDIAKDHP